MRTDSQDRERESKGRMEIGGRETELRYNDGFTPASFVLTADSVAAAIVDHVQSLESNAGGLAMAQAGYSIRCPSTR